MLKQHIVLRMMYCANDDNRSKHHQFINSNIFRARDNWGGGGGGRLSSITIKYCAYYGILNIFQFKSSIPGRSIRSIVILSGVRSLRSQRKVVGAFRTNLINAFCVKINFWSSSPMKP
jgi:hypothetical protein